MGWVCRQGGYYMTMNCVIYTGQLVLLGSEMWDVTIGWYVDRVDIT